MAGKPGWHHSKAAIAKIRKARKGKKHSAATKKKLSAAAKGRYVGAKNPAWTGGTRIDRGRVTEHVGRRKYKPRARRVAEEMIGRKLRKGEDVHHKNGIKDDDRPENLEVMKRDEHARHHSKERRRSIKTGRWS